VASAFLVFRAQYDTWRTTDGELDEEKAKNEAAPRIDMNVVNVISHGSLGEGLTDLFIYMRLVLGEPARVSIRDFTIDISDASHSREIMAKEDVEQWEVMKSADSGYSHTRCTSLSKELTRRGDPVEGWIHFPIPNLTESLVQSSRLTVNINGLYGTCYFQLQGAFVRSDVDINGVVRKIP
jgi:hypothetical protein